MDKEMLVFMLVLKSESEQGNTSIMIVSDTRGKESGVNDISTSMSKGCKM